MERRYSLSNPLRFTKSTADSTWICNLPGFQGSSNHHTQNASEIRTQSNTRNSLNNSLTKDSPNRSLHHVSRTSTSVSKMTRQKLNLSQVDPRTYADVNSSGLAARIVDYQRDGIPGLRRSISFNNVYNPLAQPRRYNVVASPLVHKPSLPSVSMTRIAPPEKSFYCGNTLPSLLRSNSLLGVEKRSEQLFRENRPIIHPHPSYIESDPTRSVLEELKEISRKRINSGELHPNEYISKKTCNRTTDYTDHPSPNIQQHLSMLQPQSGLKRQRELTVSVPLRLHHSTVASPQNDQSLALSVHNYSSFSPQQSPEQLAKRRNCNYNNDIRSSLSSSQLYNNKRKMYDVRIASNSPKANFNASNRSNSSSPENSPSQQGAKIQRNQSTSADFHQENLTRTQNTRITNLPVIGCKTAHRTLSAPIVPSITEKVKPKLTLFNAKQRQQEQQTQLPIRSPGSPEGNEYASIQFVKPKEDNLGSTNKNMHLERTQQSKLALMLSSLRGEIYQYESDADETDASKTTATSKTESAEEIKSSNQTIQAATTETPSEAVATTVALTSTISTEATKTISVLAATATEKSETSPIVATSSSPVPISTTATAPPKINNKFASLKSIEGLISEGNTSADNIIATTVTTATSMTNFFSLKPTEASTAAPVLTNLSSGIDTTSIMTTTSIPPPAQKAVEKQILKFGTEGNNRGLTPPGNGKGLVVSPGNVSVVAPAVSASVTTKAECTPVFSFGNSKDTGPSTEQVPIAPENNKTFSFGNNAINAIPSSTVAPAAPETKETVLFGSNSINFGSTLKTVTAPTAAPSVDLQAKVTQSGNIFSFGNNTAGSPASTTLGGSTAPSSTAAQPLFSFGATSTAFAGSSGNTVPVEARTENVFSFGSAAKPIGKATPLALPTKSASNSMFTFGDQGSKAPSASAFNFNSKQSPFGSNSSTDTKPFKFGETGNVQVQSQPLLQQQQQEITLGGGISFNAVAQQSQATNVFQSSNPVGTAVVKPNFSFGGTSITAAQGSSTAASPTFSGNGFPGLVAQTQSGPAVTSPINQKIFSFGSSVALNSASSPSNGIFGSTAPAAQDQKQSKPGGFSFGTSNGKSTSAITNNNTSFSFCGVTTQPQNNNSSDISKPFTFGSNTSNSTAVNIFGSTAPVSNGSAFSFGCGSGAASPTTTPQPNRFAPPSTPENRPIRRATRRLPK